MARYRKDGTLEYLGRVDNQVKVRGYRIELGEIEVTLANHPRVKSCAVLAREDEPGNKQLVGYVIPREDESPTAEDLRHFLMQKLPLDMAPAHFVFLNLIPLTPNGKIDRKALPAPDRTRPELDKAFVAPRTPTEELLAEIWAQLLDLERVGVHDNFFDLGGHSLLATQAVSRIRELSRWKFRCAVCSRCRPWLVWLKALRPPVRPGKTYWRHPSYRFHGTETWLSHLPSSDSGSSISWNRASPPTICRPVSASRDHSTWRRWSGVSMKLSDATNPCVPPLGRWRGNLRK